MMSLLGSGGGKKQFSEIKCRNYNCQQESIVKNTHVKMSFVLFLQRRKPQSWVYIEKKDSRKRNSKYKLFLFLTNELLSVVARIKWLCVFNEEVVRGTSMSLREGLKRTCSHNHSQNLKSAIDWGERWINYKCGE